MDAHNLHFQIAHKYEISGWIHCYLTFDDLAHVFDASGAIPPFHNLLDFLRSITLRRLPAWFFWDEEGYGPFFEAWPLGEPDDDNCPEFHLRIIHETNEYHWAGEGDDRRALLNSYRVMLVDADLNREAVVDVFLEALRDFVLYSKQPDEWEISMADLLSFEALRAQNIPPRSEINHAGAVDLILTRRQNDKRRRGSQHLELRMWDMSLMHWNLDDTDAFWPMWFELLEHVLNGQPYEMSFIDISFLRIYRRLAADGMVNPDEDSPVGSTRIIAIPLDHPRHFRLKIFLTNSRYSSFPSVDEVVDGLQLAGVFLKQFEDLLNEGYQPYADEDGHVFDLRELPVERLKEMLLYNHP